VVSAISLAYHVFGKYRSLVTMSSTSDRGPQPDEPQVPYYVISSCCSKAAGSRKLHIPAAGGTTPICEAETREERGEWDTKQIETRPPSWREGRWCKKCRERWNDGAACVQSDDLDGRKIASTRVSEELRERVDAYAERMGLTRGEIVRNAVRDYLVDDRGVRRGTRERRSRGTETIIDETECGLIRCMRGLGMDMDEVIDEIGAAQSTIRPHATGTCRCNTPVPPTIYNSGGERAATGKIINEEKTEEIRRKWRAERARRDN
jgi:predicted transcriptional regulator